MANDVTPYIPRNPGDLITAKDWDDVQVDIKKDIAGQIQTSIDQIKKVAQAGDSDKLEGQTADEIIQAAVKQALEQFRQTAGGYLRTFNRLQLCKERIIKHKFKMCPLVDIYSVEYFPVLCARSEDKASDSPEMVNFFLYHAEEARVRGGTPAIAVDIEPPDGSQAYRILFADLLELYHVEYTDTTTLDELENLFWRKFFDDPNDKFDADQYCHSRWFENCCGERRSVQYLKSSKDWNQIYLKTILRKTVNYDAKGTPCPPPVPAPSPAPLQPVPSPTNIQVVHFDLETVGLKLLEKPVFPAGFPPKGFTAPPDFTNELKVMVLMKV